MSPSEGLAHSIEGARVPVGGHLDALASPTSRRRQNVTVAMTVSM